LAARGPCRIGRGVVVRRPAAAGLVRLVPL
jgi:hypothetical protein